MSYVKNISKYQSTVSIYQGDESASQYNLDSLYNSNKENNNNNTKSKIKPMIKSYNNNYTKLDGSNLIADIEFNAKNSFNFSTVNSSYSSCKAEGLHSKNNELYSKNNEKDNKHISSRIKYFEIDDRYKSNIIQNKYNEKEYENIINYPSSTKEWFNSVYSYNKSYIKPLVALDLLINKLFDGYFNMVEWKVKNIFKRRRAKRYNYSSNKVHLSRAEVKHTSTSIIILLYIHNRSKFIHEQDTRKLFNFVGIKKIKSYDKNINELIEKKNRL